MNPTLQDLIDERNDRRQERIKTLDAYRKAEKAFDSSEKKLANALSPFKIGDHAKDQLGTIWKITHVSFLIDYNKKENYFLYKGKAIKRGERSLRNGLLKNYCMPIEMIERGISWSKN